MRGKAISVFPSMNDHKDVLVDTAKAAVPIAGGVFMQWLHLHDQQITELTHLIGLFSVVVGLAWYCYRFYRDIQTPKTLSNPEDHE